MANIVVNIAILTVFSFLFINRAAARCAGRRRRPKRLAASRLQAETVLASTRVRLSDCRLLHWFRLPDEFKVRWNVVVVAMVMVVESNLVARS